MLAKTTNKIINSVNLLIKKYEMIRYCSLTDDQILEIFAKESEALKVASNFRIIDEDPDLIQEIIEFNGLHIKIKTDPIFRKYYVKRTLAMEGDKSSVDLEYVLEREL